MSSLPLMCAVRRQDGGGEERTRRQVMNRIMALAAMSFDLDTHID